MRIRHARLVDQREPFFRIVGILQPVHDRLFDLVWRRNAGRPGIDKVEILELRVAARHRPLNRLNPARLAILGRWHLRHRVAHSGVNLLTKPHDAVLGLRPHLTLFADPDNQNRRDEPPRHLVAACPQRAQFLGLLQTSLVALVGRVAYVVRCERQCREPGVLRVAAHVADVHGGRRVQQHNPILQSGLELEKLDPLARVDRGIVESHPVSNILAHSFAPAALGRTHLSERRPVHRAQCFLGGLGGKEP